MNKIKDPISALTHFLGLIASATAATALVYKSGLKGSAVACISFLVFGISLICLYSASTIYHSIITNDKITRLLKRIDHIMIFILIAGSYTPICLIPLKGIWGYSLCAAVWIIALIGILLKVFWLDSPRWLSTLIYVLMGWLVVIAFVPLKNSIPAGGLALLILGGITYTLGALIYGLKLPKLNFKYFGFHEIFHLFVMGGSAFHIVFMFKYILPA